MKKMTRGLTVSGLAATAVALSAVSAAPFFATSAGDTTHTLQASRCMVIDDGAPGTPSAADRDPVKQVVPFRCT